MITHAPLDSWLNFQIKLTKSKVTGTERILARLVRLCPDLIANSLCAIYNCWINAG